MKALFLLLCSFSLQEDYPEIPTSFSIVSAKLTSEFTKTLSPDLQSVFHTKFVVNNPNEQPLLFTKAVAVLFAHREDETPFAVLGEQFYNEKLEPNSTSSHHFKAVASDHVHEETYFCKITLYFRFKEELYKQELLFEPVEVVSRQKGFKDTKDFVAIGFGVVFALGGIWMMIKMSKKLLYKFVNKRLSKQRTNKVEESISVRKKSI